MFNAKNTLMQELLKGEWILVSPHRSNRPRQGKVELRPPYDPSYERALIVGLTNQEACCAGEPYFIKKQNIIF